MFVNQVTFYSILELKQCPRCQVFLKSIQHLSLGNDVTSSDKNIVIAWLKHIFIMSPTSEEVEGAYWFGSVRPVRSSGVQSSL